MPNIFRKITRLISEGDVRFSIYEKYSYLLGKITTNISKVIYGKRLSIQSPFKVWGSIHFNIYGSGSIKIGKNLHAVSAPKRSFLAMYTPCRLTIIGKAQIIIGEHVDLNGTTITAMGKISIGNYTLIGPNTTIVDHDGHVAWPPSARWTDLGPVSEVVIGNDVWIGMNCIILKGVKIGGGSIIAAGSIVNNNVEPNSLYAGNPAKKIKSFIQ
ncbi:MAG: acyltransferase [Bacteroidia bacterium]|nr:acyltransferase [Bacteroidia bacterium]